MNDLKKRCNELIRAVCDSRTDPADAVKAAQAFGVVQQELAMDYASNGAYLSDLQKHKVWRAFDRSIPKGVMLAMAPFVNVSTDLIMSPMVDYDPDVTNALIDKLCKQGNIGTGTVSMINFIDGLVTKGFVDGAEKIMSSLLADAQPGKYRDIALGIRGFTRWAMQSDRYYHLGRWVVDNTQAIISSPAINEVVASTPYSVALQMHESGFDELAQVILADGYLNANALDLVKRKELTGVGVSKQEAISIASSGQHEAAQALVLYTLIADTLDYDPASLSLNLDFKSVYELIQSYSGQFCDQKSERIHGLFMALINNDHTQARDIMRVHHFDPEPRDEEHDQVRALVDVMLRHSGCKYDVAGYVLTVLDRANFNADDVLRANQGKLQELMRMGLQAGSVQLFCSKSVQRCVSQDFLVEELNAFSQSRSPLLRVLQDELSEKLIWAVPGLRKLKVERDFGV